MKYTLIFLIASDKKFILVEKNKPSWQKGKLNLPGGKIESHETPTQSANRELLEETGIQGNYIQEMGQIHHNDNIIHCLWSLTPYSSKIKLTPQDGETQPVNWHDWEVVRHDKRLIPNLKIIIPLMLVGQPGWIIEDHISFSDQENHKMVILI